MDYRKFYLAICRYAKMEITRGEFMIEWYFAQRCQGIKVAPSKKGATA